MEQEKCLCRGQRAILWNLHLVWTRDFTFQAASRLLLGDWTDSWIEAGTACGEVGNLLQAVGPSPSKAVCCRRCWKNCCPKSVLKPQGTFPGWRRSFLIAGRFVATESISRKQIGLIALFRRCFLFNYIIFLIHWVWNWIVVRRKRTNDSISENTRERCSTLCWTQIISPRPWLASLRSWIIWEHHFTFSIN